MRADRLGPSAGSSRRRGVNARAGRALVLPLAALLVVAALPLSLYAAATPSLSLSTAAARPGDTVVATGARFDKRADGTLTFDGSGAGMPAFRTSAGGSFSVSFVVPASAGTGSHLVRATAGSTTATATLTVAASTPPPGPTPTAQPTPAPSATPTPTATPDPGDIGTRGGSYPASVFAPTGQKPQSKLWFNDGSWWGVLYSTTNSQFEIQQFDWTNDRWIETGVRVDARTSSSADALWDGTHLVIISAAVDLSNSTSTPTTGDLGMRVLRYSYAASTRTYSLDAGFPVTLADAAVEAAVIDRDSTGVLWATWTFGNGSGGRNVLVTHSTSGDANWAAPYVLPASGATNLAADDISALVRFNGNIGVMWSNQNTETVAFATHVDGTDDRTWTLKPALQGPKYADDHLSIRSLQADPTGQVFAAVKTSVDDGSPGSQQPLILLLVLDQQGAWKRTTFGVAADQHTRPIVVVDSENRAAYVFATGPQTGRVVNGTTVFGGTIYYKATSLASPQFASGAGTAFMRLHDTATSLVNNATSTKQAVTSATGLLVLGSDDGAHVYMHNRLTIGPRVAAAPVAINGSLSVQSGEPTAGQLSASDANGDALTYAIVGAASVGTVSLTDAAAGTFQYTAPAGSSGTDSFTFRANDGGLDSNVATVTVTISAPSLLRGAWLMNEGSGSSLLDSSGGGNDGQTRGGPVWVTGHEALALHLGGTADYCVVNSIALDLRGPLTLAAWVRPQRVATQYIIKKATFGTADGYELALSTAGKIFFRLNQATSGNTFRIDSATVYPANGSTWIHIAATFDGTTMRLYVNGVEDGRVAGPSAVGGNSLALGLGAQPDGISPLQGDLDEVRVWARALSASEIQGLLGP